ncbi:hypothetical protein [Psychrobacter sp. G]|uniref:hypothetical protein n=1 Tax=Psychrobacter sp. G TaxID=571800 RepID=UPI0006872F7C|nr:hypothetical protein [Psychrobacter sp. G]
MLVKFFSRGSGGGDSPVNYLLGEDREREGASILRGNPEITKELINSTDYARRYTSGCLSFEEAPDAVTDKTKAQIMDIFEQTIFAGLESDQYNILWVEHTDKDKTDTAGNVIKDADGKPIKRLELNFLIPNQELRSGKRLQPFFHWADMMRINAYQNVMNMRYKLTDPHDPSKRRSHTPYFSRSANLKGVDKKDYTEEQERLTTHKAEKDDLTNYIYDLAARGRFENRKAIQKALKGKGYEIKRVTKRSISVSSPKFAKNIRLDDPIFSEDFKPYDYIDMALHEKQKQYERDKQGKILKEALAILNKGIEIKTEYHAERFSGEDMPKIPKPFDLGLDAPVSAQAHITEQKPTEQDNSPSMGF